MSEFEKKLHDMFDDIWNCSIDHPKYEDTVGELMGMVIEYYNNITKQTNKYSLKHCPFCGGEAELMKMGYPHYVYCIECGAKVHGGKFGAEGEQASIEAWNRRQE